MGFCLFNNVAIAAQWAVQQPGVDRVAIVDFDVHHGNGTQEIFYRSDDVLYVSTHQHPLYPGTGSFAESGAAAGRGYNLNFPIPPGQGNDLYADLHRHLIGPVLGRFSPDLILVSAGFDGHRADPLAGMRLDESGFRELASILNTVASKVAPGRIVYVLEGGYDLDALASSVLSVLSECLAHTEERSDMAPASFPDSPYLRHALNELETHARIWSDVLVEKN
jgi:acetoin utilization deacetylase AcuC-like enzyme